MNLNGFTIVLTQTRATPLAKILRSLGATVKEIPLIKIVPVDTSVLTETFNKLKDYDWIFLTSSNAVDCFLAHSPFISNIQVAAIGSATAEKTIKTGWNPSVCSKGKGAVELLYQVNQHYPLKNKKILYPCSDLSKSDLKQKALELGVNRLDKVTVYKNIMPEYVSTHEFSMADSIIFGSNSAIDNYIKLGMNFDKTKNLSFVAIGPTTATLLKQCGAKKIEIASSPQVQDIVVALFKSLKKKEPVK